MYTNSNKCFRECEQAFQFFFEKCSKEVNYASRIFTKYVEQALCSPLSPARVNSLRSMYDQNIPNKEQPSGAERTFLHANAVCTKGAVFTDTLC